MNKLTPWFPASVKPARVGVYNVSCQSSNQSGNWYSYWNGERFGWYETHPSNVSTQIECEVSDSTQSWRGLASDPRSQA